LRWDSIGDRSYASSIAPTADVSGAQATIAGPRIVTRAVSSGAQAMLSLVATNTGGGVKDLFYSTDGTTYQSYTGPFAVSRGAVVNAFADDNLGNRTASRVTVDESILLPGISATPAPAPSAAGWNNGDVAVTLSGSAGRHPITEIDFTITGAQTGTGVISGAQGIVTITAEGTSTITFVAKDTAADRQHRSSDIRQGERHPHRHGPLQQQRPADVLQRRQRRRERPRPLLMDDERGPGG
jgi:hypothetical protein